MTAYIFEGIFYFEDLCVFVCMCVSVFFNVSKLNTLVRYIWNQNDLFSSFFSYSFFFSFVYLTIEWICHVHKQTSRHIDKDIDRQIYNTYKSICVKRFYFGANERKWNVCVCVRECKWHRLIGIVWADCLILACVGWIGKISVWTIISLGWPWNYAQYILLYAYESKLDVAHMKSKQKKQKTPNTKCIN